MIGVVTVPPAGGIHPGNRSYHRSSTLDVHAPLVGIA